MAVTSVALPPLHWPISGWGSMFLKGNPNKTEEDYFLKDFSEEEIKEGTHLTVMKFAAESKSQRGYSRQKSAVQQSVV